jgi:hypothetical protein
MVKENRGPEVEAVAILFLTLAWISVSLRYYVRAVMMKSFGMDDWLAIVALVSVSPENSFPHLLEMTTKSIPKLTVLL